MRSFPGGQSSLDPVDQSARTVGGYGRGTVSLEVMDSVRVLGDIDLISVEELRTLGSIEGPCLSVFMPTHRHGSETLQGPVRLRNLAGQAARELEATGVAPEERKSLLAPIRELIDDSWFWQHQGDGLALFAAPGWFRRYRLPIQVPEEASVSRSFRVRPLLAIVGGDGTFLVLALSENSVRLFEATRYSIAELDSRPIPGSMAEALAHEDPERQLQVRSGGQGTAEFHGHGQGGEVDKAALERYFRAVDRGLRDRVGSSQLPLVLACVGYYQPIFRSISDYPVVIDEVIEGSPDRRTAEDLHASGWPLVEPLLSAGRDAAIDLYREMSGTGRTATAIAEIADHARQGRVDALLIAHDAPHQWGSVDEASSTITLSGQRRPLDDDLVDVAALDTIQRGGSVHVIAEAVEPNATIAAILRY